MKWLIRLGPYVHRWGKNGEYDVCRSPIYIRIVRNRVKSMKRGNLGFDNWISGKYSKKMVVL